MALKLAIVRVRDDTGKLDTEIDRIGETVPAVLFDADLGSMLAEAIQRIEQTRPGALRPLLRRAHDLAYRLATEAVTDALTETERRLKHQTINLT